MKKHWTAQLASDLVCVRTVDQTAQTTHEIATIKKMCRSAIQPYIKQAVDAGKLEQVWKRDGTKIVPAYRPKK